MKEATKIENCLYALLEVGLDGLRQLEVCSPYSGQHFTHMSGYYWSTALSSNISKLGKKGVKIDRKIDPYRKANFKRYWIKDRATAQLAVVLVNFYRYKRNAQPLPYGLAMRLIKRFPETAHRDAEGAVNE